MLAFIDEVQRIGKIQRIGAQRMAGNLAVENIAGDIGIVGRNLAPALCAGFRKVARTKPTNSLQKVSSFLIFMVFSGNLTHKSL